MPRLILALFVLVVDLWSVAAVLGAPVPRRTRWLWVVAIVLLPVAGWLVWLRLGPRPSPPVRGAP